MVIVFAIQILMYTVPDTIGFTISALVGQAIGSGKIKQARKVMWICLLSSFSIMILIVITIHFHGRAFIESFIDDPYIVDLAHDNLKIYCHIYFIQGMQ